MCTALSINSGKHYFGRNLDFHISYGEKICVMPRHFPLSFRMMGETDDHFAMIGMAAVEDNIPLFFDAANEHGLSMAGLYFPENAYYPPEKQDRDNVTPYEFITWILSQCSSIDEASKLLSRINLVRIPFSKELPLAPLHFIISDKTGSLTVEPMRDGLSVKLNPHGILTNNPPFELQLFNLNNYRMLSSITESTDFSEAMKLDAYSAGLGGIGLPGDASSMSRFVRIAFNSCFSQCEPNEIDSVTQFFHLLGSVEMIRGSCKNESGEHEITRYSCCIDSDAGRYYYSTYSNRQISCVDMTKEDLCGSALSLFALSESQQILYQN